MTSPFSSSHQVKSGGQIHRIRFEARGLEGVRERGVGPARLALHVPRQVLKRICLVKFPLSDPFDWTGSVFSTACSTACCGGRLIGRKPAHTSLRSIARCEALTFPAGCHCISLLLESQDLEMDSFVDFWGHSRVAPVRFGYGSGVDCGHWNGSGGSGSDVFSKKKVFSAS